MNLKLEDVAREAGVSIATVSRVMNNRAVKESTRIRVEEVIARLDYRPNLLARGLVKGQSSRIGVVVSNMENPYFSTIMNSMELRFRQANLICSFSSSIDRGDEERDILQRYMDSGVDGLVIVDVGPQGINSSLYGELNRHLPVVVINGNPERNDVNHILMDQSFGMNRVMDYFFSLNHREILFVRGVGGGSSFDIKEEVFLERLKEVLGEARGDLVAHVEDFNHFTCADQTCELLLDKLKKREKPTALFLCNEIMASGALKALGLLGLSVPEDISVITHDNTFLSRFSNPPLTTVDMNPGRLGLESAEMMIQLLNMKNPSPRRLIFNPELIIRDSCGQL